MAKSKSGGSRAYIRGRIGSDVYSIGKNAKGARQQVIRSLAEQVSNPRTQSQMFGRMLMSTVMQAVSALRPIIDHSFDGFPAGQPCISEFIKQNYALVKADAVAHPASGNKFNLSKYQEKGMQCGPYVVSKGSIVIPAAYSYAGGFCKIDCGSNLTVGGLKAAMGISTNGYITVLAWDDNKGMQFARVRLTTALADSTAITSQNVGSLFSQEGSINATFSVEGTKVDIAIDITQINNLGGFILSDLVDGVWNHSSSTLYSTIEDTPQTADVALPTYPTGSQQFLNGGDL